MAKKIYDIKPPKMAHKGERSLKEILESEKVKKQPKRIKNLKSVKKETPSFRFPIAAGVLVIALVAGVFLFFKLPKAEITISPKVETLSFKQTITADKTANSINIADAIIPAEYFQATKTNSQDFPATGNASNEGYASGTITIYNKYDPVTSMTLKAGTHFMSDSGKIFVASQKIVVPAAKKSGSKITPGSVQVKIQAVEGGTDYNIAPSNFSIPGLKGTAYYYSIYATSTSAMTGGYAGKVKKVTDDDIQGAKDVLTDKTSSDALAALKEQISSDYVLLENAVLSKTTTATTETKAGTVAEKFNYKVSIQASALAFKKADLDQFAKNYLNSQMPNGKTLIDNSFKVDYSASTVDVSGGKMTLNIDFSSGFYQTIDRNSMALNLLGQNSSQIKETINGILGDQVIDTNVKFWPFWVTAAPNSQKAVKIELKF